MIAVVGLIVAMVGVSADRRARQASDELAAGHTNAALIAARSAVSAEPSQTMPALVLAQAAMASRSPAQMERIIGELEAVRARSIDDGRIILVEGRVLEACGVDCESNRPGIQERADQLVRRDPARSDGWRLEADLAEDRSGPSDELKRIHRIAAETVSAVRDIVWLLRPQGDHRIDPRRTLRGSVRGQKRGAAEQQDRCSD